MSTIYTINEPEGSEAAGESEKVDMNCDKNS